MAALRRSSREAVDLDRPRRRAAFRTPRPYARSELVSQDVKVNQVGADAHKLGAEGFSLAGQVGATLSEGEVDVIGFGEMSSR